MPSYQVRSAADKDAEAIAAVHAASSHAAYEGLVPDQHATLPMEKRRAFWRDAIAYSEPQVHVAIDAQGALIGFTGFDRSRDPRSKPTTGEIWAMYVVPSHWNTGAGLSLWDATREGLMEEGCTEVTLWIPLCNDRAIRFFELAGFKRENNTAKTAVMAGVKLEEVRLKRKLD